MSGSVLNRSCYSECATESRVGEGQARKCDDAASPFLGEMLHRIAERRTDVEYASPQVCAGTS